MMNTELTHEQSRSCRMFLAEAVTLHCYAAADYFVIGFAKMNKDQAAKALAAYDAKWCNIERAQLEHVVKRGRTALNALYNWADAPDSAIPILEELLGALDRLENSLK